MRKSLQEPVRVYKKKYKTRKAFRRIACVLGCVVAFVTTYALILPAITMEQTAFCGIEEHIHDESCYQRQIEKYEMICDVGLQLHVHSSECYHENGSILCGQADYVVHSHDAFCWDAEGQLICTLPERAAHIHDSGCYTMPEPVVHSHSDACITEVMGDLICTQQTDQGHMHAEACYSEETQLVCELEEDHIHDDTCYRQVLLCQTEESEGHTHSEVCYQWNQTYLCGLEEGQQEAAEPQLVCSEPVAQTHIHTEDCFKLQLTGAELVCGEDHAHAYNCYEKTCTLMEHTHSLQCYSDPDADVETQQTWESTLQNVELTGDKYLDVIAIAESQLGYVESTRNYIVGEDNSIYGYTRYGDWYGVPYGDWCAMYASFCLRYAGVDTMPIHSGVCSWIDALTEADLYHPAAETQPKPGCLVFFDWEEDDDPDHVGIVVEVTEAGDNTAAKLKTIEGNSRNAVQYETYDLADPAIVGYGFLPEENRDTLLDSLICGTPAHTHDDSCVDCQIMEHTHTIACADPESPMGHAFYETMMRARFAMRSNDNTQYYSDVKPLLESVTIKDDEGNTIYPNGSATDPIEIFIGEMYEVTISFQELTSKQFADGELTYQIPAFLVSENVANGTIEDDETHNLVATYKIENNLLTVTPYGTPNFFLSHNNAGFEINFNAEAVINEESDYFEIDFGNNHTVNVDKKENGTIKNKKELVSYDPETRILSYKCTTTAHGGTIKIDEISDWWWSEGGNVSPDDVTISGVVLTDGNGTNISDQWNISVYPDGHGKDMITLRPKNPCYLDHGESIIVTYQSTLSEDITEDFKYVNQYYNYGWFDKKELKETATLSTPITFNNVKKSGAYESETVNGIQNALMWTVEIPNPEKHVITVTDELIGKQTYCQHKNISLEATKEDNTIVKLTVPWTAVQLNDEHTSFTYTLPQGYVKYVLKYSSHYEVDAANPNVQTFDNTIKTYINGSTIPNVGTGSVDVLGIPPTIRKEITAITDDYLTFSVECFMPASLNGKNSILLYDSLTSWGNVEGYVDNDPENLTVTVNPKNGDPYELEPYVDQQSTENTYLSYDDGAGFTMLFNTSQQDSKTSIWKCPVDSTLTISYQIPLDAPMLTWWSGEETGETLRQFLDRTGQKLTNKADLFFLPDEYVTNSTEYTPPAKTLPNLSKTGEVAKNQDGVPQDGVFNYTVWFNPCEEDRLFNTLNGNNDVSGLTITDTFDYRMEYVPGSLKVSLWGIWSNNNKAILKTFAPKDGSISQQDITLEDGTKVTQMTVSAENLIGQSEPDNWMNGKPLSEIMPQFHETYRYEITYQLRVKAEEKKTTEGVFYLDNSVSVDWTDTSGPRSIGPVEHEMVYNTGILDKSAHPHEGNNNLLDFEIIVNHYGLDLAPESESYVLHDTMSSNLMLIYNTLKIEILDEDGNIIKTLSLDDCNFTYEPDLNRLNFTLPDEKIIRLSYECKVNGVGGRSTNVKNTVELEGYSSIQDAVDTMFEVKDHHGSASASSTFFTLQKQDAYTLHALPDVSFELYGDTDPEGDEKTLEVGGTTLHYYGTFKTDDHGRVRIEHTQLLSGHKYALVEVEPPPGYLEQEEPYVFYMGYDAPAGIDIVAEGGFLVIQNYPIGYELPETGGAGHSLYIGAGLLLILTSAAYLMYIHSKRRKEVP